MSNIIGFPKPLPKGWIECDEAIAHAECECGKMLFILKQNGEIECSDCGNILDGLEVRECAKRKSE
jgi:hypothetical protein